MQLGCHPVAIVQYTFTHKQYTERHKNFGRMRAVSRLCELYPGICLTTEEKARKNLRQGSRTIRIRKPNNKITSFTVLKHGKPSVRIVEQ